MERVDAVTAFVTRDRELLVCRRGGVLELPCATVDPGEAAEMRAVREVREVTGLSVELVAKLGSVSGVTPGEVVLTLPVVVGEPLPRGAAVEKVAERTSDVEVRHNGVRRWIGRDAVTTNVVQHFIHVRADASAPDHWTHADVECCWTPLGEEPGLVRGHARWLDLVRRELVHQE